MPKFARSLRRFPTVFELFNMISPAHNQLTFWMIGSTASTFSFWEEDAAGARPFGICESGTRIGLCLRMAFFF